MGKTTLLQAAAATSSTARPRWPTSPTRCCPSRASSSTCWRIGSEPRGVPRPAAGRAAELPARAAPHRPEHGADPRRGAEPLPADARADPAAVELRDDQGEDPPDRARRPAGARGRLELPELRQLKQRIGLRCHDPAADGRETRDYIRTACASPAPATSASSPRPRSRVSPSSGRHPPRGQHGVRSLPADRLRRQHAADRRGHRGRGIEYLEEGGAPGRVAQRRAAARGWRRRSSRSGGLGAPAMRSLLAGAAPAPAPPRSFGHACAGWGRT